MLERTIKCAFTRFNIETKERVKTEFKHLNFVTLRRMIIARDFPTECSKNKTHLSLQKQTDRQSNEPIEPRIDKRQGAETKREN